MPWSLRMITYASVLMVIGLAWMGFRYFCTVKDSGLKPGTQFRLLFSLPVLLFLAYPVGGHIQFWFTGSFNLTGFPHFMIYLFWYGVVFTGVSINWLILHDLFRPLVSRFSGADPFRIRIIFAVGFLILLSFTALWTGGKMVWDSNRISIQELTYTMPAGEEFNESLTIVHIADIHADEFTRAETMGRYVDVVNAAMPDIVIIAGDLITSGEDHIEAGAEAMSEIESTHGVFFVMGDHDYWVGSNLIEEVLVRHGIMVLEDANAYIDHGDERIKITGVTELYSRRIPASRLDELLYEEGGESLHILGSHQASERLIHEAREAGVHQLLGGHTHGGQIRVPILFYPVTAARAETPYVIGSWQMGDMLLNINNGLGYTLAPVRYNAPAQVSVIRVGNM
ncbi:MAG: metallophosphoesterase [Balneolaceae bacterium]|nr:metallophosphoesterase [Balneolaceae bacterium]